MSARRLLEAEGFAVVGEASDGQGALAAAEQLHPDLVLLDVSLPDIDGLEVAARLAAAGSPAVVVLSSSRAASEYGSTVAQTPARAFIPKAELSGAALAGLVSAQDWNESPPALCGRCRRGRRCPSGSRQGGASACLPPRNGLGLVASGWGGHGGAGPVRLEPLARDCDRRSRSRRFLASRPGRC